MPIINDIDVPLARAEEIVRRGPNPDGGKLPCEGEPEASCLTFTEINRLRYSVAECGCQFEGADRIGLCDTHAKQGGPKVSYEDREEASMIDYTAEWQQFRERGAAAGATAYEDKD